MGRFTREAGTRMQDNRTPHGYYPRTNPLARVRTLWRHMRGLERAGHLSVARQIGELIVLRVRRGVGPAQYLSAGLYRRELSWGQKLEYVGGTRYARLIHSINPVEYDYVARNKLETYKILTANGVPTPPVYGVVEGASGWTWDGDVLRSPDDLVSLVERLGTDTVCFKYVTGTRGRGFYRVTVDTRAATVTIHPSGDTRRLAEFWETLRGEKLFSGYFCQGVIEQHPDVARLNPWCVNTVRTWMVRTAGGEWKMAMAVLRIGVGEIAVDNLSQGAIGAAVDLDTGRLAAARQRTVQRPVYPRHPVTSAQIEGTVLPEWSEAKALCKRTADLFPYYLLLSVDVAFTHDGPLVVELGTTPDEMQGEWGSGAYPVLLPLKQRGRVDVAP
jgi:hypothetical protein